MSDRILEGIHAALDELEGRLTTTRVTMKPRNQTTQDPDSKVVTATSRGSSGSTYTYQQAKEIFNRVDKDKSGEIDLDELEEAFTGLGLCATRTELQDMISECDADGDGLIQEDEFMTMVRKVQSSGSNVWKALLDRASNGMLMLDGSHKEEYDALPENILVNLAKAGGTAVMLRDNKGSIYKEMNDESELEFYTLVHEARKGGKFPDPFLRYLNSERLIPRCELLGHVIKLSEEEEAKLPPNKSGYYKQIDQPQKEPIKSVKVIIMENLIAGMDNPAFCDFKLGDQFTGSYPGEPGFDECKKLRDNNELLTITGKERVFKKWKEYKGGKNTDGLTLKQVTNVQLGLRTELTFKEIKPLMKAFRQEINNLESPVKELKFRCCGMKLVPGEGQPVKLRHEPYASQGQISITKPVGMSPAEVADLVEDFCQADIELANYFIHRLNTLSLWFSNNTHYRFYASSVCMFYDMNDHSKRDMRWLDFAHAHKMVHEDGSSNWERKNNGGEINVSVHSALGNLCDCLAPVVWQNDDE